MPAHRRYRRFGGRAGKLDILWITEGRCRCNSSLHLLYPTIEARECLLRSLRIVVGRHISCGGH